MTERMRYEWMENIQMCPCDTVCDTVSDSNQKVGGEEI